MFSFNFGSPLNDMLFGAQQQPSMSLFDSLFFPRFQQMPEQNHIHPNRQNFVNTKLKKTPSKTVPPKVQYNPKQSMYWKQLGNEAYFACQFQKSLQYYQKAIQIDGSNSIFHSNKARVLKQLKRYQQGLKSAQQAIQLDSNNYKGHLICGQILAQISKSQAGVQKTQLALVRLRKAYTLYSMMKGQQKKDQISVYIYRCKKLLWYKKYQILKKLKIQNSEIIRKYINNDINISPQIKQQRLAKYSQTFSQNCILQIPDYLQCKITFQLMQDPVCIQSGHTYQRQAIQQHLQKNGLIDPLSRQPVSGKLYPNLSIKKAVQDFLQSNPWAFQFSQGEDYHDIQF